MVIGFGGSLTPSDALGIVRQAPPPVSGTCIPDLYLPQRAQRTYGSPSSVWSRLQRWNSSMHRIFTTVSNERALPYCENALYWQSRQAHQAGRRVRRLAPIVQSAAQLSAAERPLGSWHLPARRTRADLGDRLAGSGGSAGRRPSGGGSGRPGIPSAPVLLTSFDPHRPPSGR
jgi:hypothetical protein